MREPSGNDVMQENAQDSSRYLKNKNLAGWGCLLVALTVIAILIVIFVIGPSSTIPGNEGAGP